LLPLQSKSQNGGALGLRDRWLAQFVEAAWLAAHDGP
jgi:hypothetical protein